MVWSFTSFDVLRSERYGKYGQNGHCEKLVGPVWEGKPTNYMLGRMMWHGASLKVGLCSTEAREQHLMLTVPYHIMTWTWIHWQVLLGYLGYRTIQVLIPHMPIWWKNVNLIFGGLKMWTRINTLDGCKHRARIAVKQRSRIASSDSVPACSK